MVILAVAVLPSFIGTVSSEMFSGWQVAEGPYVDQYPYGGAYSESNGIITLTKDDRAAGPTLFRDFSPTQDFEISLQVKAETLSANGGPLSGGSGEGFRLLLQDKGERPTKGVNLEVRGRNGGEFWMAWRSARCDLYGWQCDINAFVINPPVGSKIVEPDVWYTMKLTVHQNPYTMTGAVYSENGTQLGSLTIDDITNFGFAEIKVVEISTLPGGTFCFKNFTISNLPSNSQPSQGSYLGWQVGPEQGGKISVSNSILTLAGGNGHDLGPCLYREFKPQTDFEFSFDLKAETLGDVVLDQAGEGYVFSFGALNLSTKEFHVVSFWLRARAGGQFLLAWHDQLCDDNGWECNWKPFVYNGLSYDNGYAFWHPNPPADRSNAAVKPDVWYTVTLKVQRTPFAVTGAVYAENGTKLGSLVIDGMNDLTFEEIEYAYMSAGAGGAFYVKNFKITNLSNENAPEDGTFTGWRIRPQGGNYSVTDGTMKLWTEGAPNNATVLYTPVLLKTNFFISLQVKAPIMKLDSYQQSGQMPVFGDFKVGFISDDLDFATPSSYPLESYGKLGDLYSGNRNVTATRADGSPWNCYDYEFGFPENIWYTVIISVQRSPFAVSNVVLDESGRYLCSSSVSGEDDPSFDKLAFVYITPCAKGDFYVRNINVTQPEGDFTFSPCEPLVNSQVVFNATEKAESYRHTYIYTWDFGDGNVTSTKERTITHSFDSAGTFNVTLTATYYYGGFSTVTKTLTVSDSTFLSINTSSSSNAAGSIVNVSGRLYEADGSPLRNKTVVLSYSFEGASVTIPISSAVTDENGGYFIQWINSASGTFTLHVAWFGDATHPSIGNSTTLTFVPFASQHAFVVESNSTITSMAFNSTASELNFNATGPSGTTGYVKVTIAKTLLSDAADLRVNLDGKKLTYTLSETEDAWIVTFNYTHSTHQISLFMPHTVASLPQSNPAVVEINYWLLAGIVFAIVIVGCVLGLAFRGSRKRQLSDYYL